MAGRAAGRRRAYAGLVRTDPWRCSGATTVGFGVRAIRPARLLSRQPDLVGLYSVGAGNRGIAAALEASGRAHDIIWIAHELTVHTRDLVLRGVIDAIINQDPGHEARSAARVLLAHRWGDPVMADQERINIDIFLRDNLP